MLSLITAFFSSFIVSILIIRTKKIHGQLSGDLDLTGPQKFHKRPVPRVGGLAILCGIIFSFSIAFEKENEGFLKLIVLFCAFPIFLVGVTEDITKKVSVRSRLFITATGALLICLFLNCNIDRLGFPAVDLIFKNPVISIAFTVFAITGLSNAYNIVDGFNGLSSMIGIITLSGLGYVSIKLNDPVIAFLCLSMASAILGFFLLNYPKGLIFLGDGGAYLIGFWVAVASVLIASRHQTISPWFAVLINAYPIMETLFTIYRRKFHQGKSPGHPDGIHLHSLIFRRVLSQKNIKTEYDFFNANSMTSPYLWLLSTLAIAPAILFPTSNRILILFFLGFALFYLWLYNRIVSFRIPRWMHILE